MSDTFKYDPTDLEDDGEVADSTDTSTGTNTGLTDAISGLLLLPFSVIGLYAVTDKAAVLAAIEALVGAGGVASAITAAFWVVGVVTVAVLGVMLAFTVGAFIAGLVTRSKSIFGLSMLGVAYFAGGSAGALTYFNSLPFLVGFILTTNLILGGAFVTVLALVGFVGLVLAAMK